MQRSETGSALEALILSPDATKERRKQTIKKLHLLVHPGWVFKDNPFAKLHPGSNELKQKYVDYSETLGPEELMVTFAPAIGEEFVHDMRAKHKPAYAEIISKIKEKLGDRLIVLADSDLEEDMHRGATFEPNKEKVWERIRTIAKKRGFRFSPDLTEEAYGELIHACVQLIADNLHQAAEISQSRPAVIKADLTDYAMQLSLQSRKLKAVYQQLPRETIFIKPNIKIDFEPFEVDKSGDQESDQSVNKG